MLHQYLKLVTMQNSVVIDQYLEYLISPKYLSALCAIAYTNTKLIQTFSIKISLASRKDTEILQFVDQIHNNFDQHNFTLEVFIDLSKAFDKVDHNILLKKLEINGTVGKNLQWLKKYLNNRKQYIQINNEEKANYC